ncbi:hypothetical protein [Thiomicrorhabdus sp. 6S3-12]|uniref:hypothetical protein n=1 Tax=Thiomicrorhabdus sp. 6S3-12 TaxID=2819681 RepID=UPI001AAD0BF2|nr:hypothetical protein [Thiomicrorhabdus sp. 6S3-12]MBO1924210.1 hypothetical protein [Thiomicrorhabdus sp. 6S3-12]
MNTNIQRYERTESAENIMIHLDNKKEAFAAMRAYHESEIAHKGHAISVLTTMLQATILVYGGLFGLMLKDGISISVVQMSGIACLLFISFASRKVALSTQEKIRQDNIQYCLHYFEYRKERELLGIESDLIEHDFVSKAEEINKKARGRPGQESNQKICEKLSQSHSGGSLSRLINDFTGLHISKIKSNSGHMYSQDILMNLVRVILLVCIIGTTGIFLLGMK